MNVFEDLIVELKQENLLEDTVMDGKSSDNTAAETAVSESPVVSREDEVIHDEVDAELSAVNAPDFEFELKTAAETAVSEPPVVSDEDEVVSDEVEPEPSEAPTRDFEIDLETALAERPATDEKVEIETYDSVDLSDKVLVDPGRKAPPKPRKGNEFYKKRAVAEISNLQMVEHVLTGVERGYMKLAPKTYDDFGAKKALNTFLNVNEGENSEQHAEAEFALMSETEAWCTALAARDREIQVSNLRLYCERSAPPLSSQALVALARFYRNLPFSEPVRAKFDFLITRLFSKAIDNKRDALFTREEMLNHITTLYREWSSIALYTAEDDESKMLLTSLSFEDLAVEAENTPTFDLLVKSDFFGRLRVFKESTTELFYAPQVTAAAIECNIRVGNVYVDLLAKERDASDADSIQARYGVDDHAVSDAAGRTLNLVELMRKTPEPVPIVVEIPEPDKAAPMGQPSPAPSRDLPKAKAIKVTKENSQFFGNIVANARGVNRWFLGLSMAIIAGSLGLYLWGNVFIREEATTKGVTPVTVDNSIIGEHVKTARISGTTYYALMGPSWDVLSKEKRQEFLQKIYQSAVEKGCTQVKLTNKEGKSAGFASASRLEVVMP